MQFAQSFWNSEHCDHTGFNIVCDYLRAERHASEAVVEFLNARAQIEEQYAKKLLNLAKNQANVRFEGSLGVCWDAVVNATEKSAIYHQKSADTFAKQAQNTDKLQKKMKQSAKQKVADVRYLQAECKRLYESALKHKSKFTKHTQQKRVLDEELARLSKDAANAKEAKNLELDSRKNATAVDTCRQKCMEILQQLEQTRQKWEINTDTALTEFQEMERIRITYLRGLLWLLMNIASQTCVDEDKECDAVRQVILRCDPDADLSNFITAKQTGSIKPEKIKFNSLPGTISNTSMPKKLSISTLGRQMMNSPWKSINNNQPPVPISKVSADSSPIKHQATVVIKQPLQIVGIEEFSSGTSSQENSPSDSGSPTHAIIDEPDLRRSAMNRNGKTGLSGNAESGFYIVTEACYDKLGKLLLRNGAIVKLIQKTDPYWLVELGDGQRVPCPKHCLQEVESEYQNI